MKESYEPALRRLDKWFYEMFKRNYTSEVEREVKTQISERMRRSRELSDIVYKEFLDNYSKDKMLTSSTSYWTQCYKEAETLTEGKTVNGANIATFPKRLRREYVEPLVWNFKKIKGFVDKVRRDIKQKNVLSDEEINRLFLDQFGSVQKYIELFRETSKLSVSFYIAYNKPNDDEREKIKGYNDIIHELAHHIINAVFSDLNTKSLIKI